MRFSSADLNLIIARASTLSERLGKGFGPVEDDGQSSKRRLARLREISREMTPLQVAAKLHVADSKYLTEPELLAALGSVKVATPDAPPAWTSDLNFIVAAVSQFFASKDCGQTLIGTRSIRCQPLPYEHLYWPIAEAAWDCVRAERASTAEKLSLCARNGLQRYLVRRIASFASNALHPAFLAHKSFASSSMTNLFRDALPTGAGRRDEIHQYARFVYEQGEDGLSNFFLRFPVAARLIAEIVRFWIDFAGEFLDRLHADERKLAACFNDNRPLGEVVGLDAGLSDPHKGGRSVIILTCRGGLRLVYKPRSLGIDQCFYGLIRETNLWNPFLGLKVVQVCDQGTHGWMEFVSPGPCLSGAAAKRYYERGGALACLTHWLQGIDMHRENVVAAGEHPVLIDLECLAHPPRPDELLYTADNERSLLAHSVLRTGLLPLKQSLKPGSPLHDVCGYNGVVRRQAMFPSVRWHDVNTDRMHWEHQVRNQRHRAHRACLRGRLLRLRDFEREVLAGYEAMSSLLEGEHAGAAADHREQIYAAASRRIKRPTFVYAILMQHSLDPRFLSDGVDRSIELLSLPCGTGDEAEWAAEILSLERLDIPYFRFLPHTKIGVGADRMERVGEQTEPLKQSIRGNSVLRAGRIEKLRRE